MSFSHAKSIEWVQRRKRYNWLTCISELDGTEGRPTDNGGRVVRRGTNEIRPHPAYIRLGLVVGTSQLSTVTGLGDLAFTEPVSITHEGVIFDGFSNWEVARLQHRSIVVCIEYGISEEEALYRLIQRHHPSSGLNDFIRICLALEFENSLKEKARANQQASGRNQASSNLTKRERRDVRREIARIAGVSAGNVTKVKNLMDKAHPDVIQALQQKELSIHQAWLWTELSPEEQRKMLSQRQSERGIRRTIQQLVAAHVPKNTSPVKNNLIDLPKLISALQSHTLDSITVVAVDIPGRAVFVTKELLGSPERLPLECATNTP